MRKFSGAMRFTLVELLVVIAIVAILSALLLPALGKARGMALSSQCQSNQRQCGVALIGYANDFSDWVIGGQCGAYVQYGNLSTMMMGLDYIPYVPPFKGVIYGWPTALPPGGVFQCPALRPPTNYFQLGGAYTSASLGSNTSQSYGLRTFWANSEYYPGEQQPSNTVSYYLMKLSSLYKPSEVPYMVDSETPVNDSTNTNIAGKTQWNYWYLPHNNYGIGGTHVGMHLRHNKRGNVWCPDGHVGSWDASDANMGRIAGAGVVSSYPFGYSY